MLRLSPFHLSPEAAREACPLMTDPKRFRHGSDPGPESISEKLRLIRWNHDEEPVMVEGSILMDQRMRQARSILPRSVLTQAQSVARAITCSLATLRVSVSPHVNVSSRAARGIFDKGVARLLDLCRLEASSRRRSGLRLEDARGGNERGVLRRGTLRRPGFGLGRAGGRGSTSPRRKAELRAGSVPRFPCRAVILASSRRPRPSRARQAARRQTSRSSGRAQDGVRTLDGDASFASGPSSPPRAACSSGPSTPAPRLHCSSMVLPRAPLSPSSGDWR